MDAEQQGRRSRILLELGARLRATAGDFAHLRGEVRGTMHDVPVLARLAASGDDERTEVDVPMAHARLELELRPQTTEEEHLRDAGAAVDVVIGDEAFDAAFIVEAAPVDVVRALLGPDLRARLLAAAPVIVRTVAVDTLRVVRHGWPQNAAHATPLVELAVEIAQRVPAAFDEADQALRAQGHGGGGPFREQVDAEAARAAAGVRQRDFLALAVAKQRRRVRERLGRLLAHLFGRR
jgi:hypothetical protein